MSGNRRLEAWKEGMRFHVEELRRTFGSLPPTLTFDQWRPPMPDPQQPTHPAQQLVDEVTRSTFALGWRYALVHAGRMASLRGDRDFALTLYELANASSEAPTSAEEALVEALGDKR